VVQRKQLRAPGAFAAIELHRVQAQHVHAEPDRALGKTGPGVEDETLRPLFGLALGFAGVGEVAVDVVVSEVGADLRIIDEALGHRGKRHQRTAQQ